ncbi:MAG TPA: molybdopterin cofactor-binding domain-containing protein [Planctomycetota bacterium]
MNLPWQTDPFLHPLDREADEPERYELHEPPRHRLDLERRTFLQLFGSGIAIALVAAPASGRSEQLAGPAPQDPPATIDAWLHIGADGAVTALTGKVEVGQDIRTSLAQAIAEELTVPPVAVQLVMGDTDRVPYDRGTFGSRTTPTMALQLRRAAAAARAWLVELAAEQLAVPAGELRAEAGAIVHAASQRTLPFGNLTAGKAMTRGIGAADVRAAAEWKVCGTSAPRAIGKALVTGAHRFPSDILRPGMQHGCVLRPPAFGAELEALDDQAARAMPGVRVVRDGTFTGVVAPTAHLARQAVQALVPRWKQPAELASESTLAERLRRPPARGGGGERGGEGRGGRGGDRTADRAEIDRALAASAHQVTATFAIPYIAHAPLEPRAAVAEWQDGAVTVWTGTQRPFGVREELMRALRLPAEKVRVQVPDTGSGYGGKHTGDAAIEAAVLAKAAQVPVAVLWSREEEFTWAYFRPAGLVDVRASVDKDGMLTAWELQNFNSGGASLASPYAVALRREQFHQADSPLRQGSYRALATTCNTFARECTMDDLAAAAGLDPLKFRRQNLQNARLGAVLDAAAERAGWATPPGAGVGRGIACGTDKGGYVATVADVRVAADQKIEVLRLVTAFECGAIVHPDNTKNQVEGAVVQALGGALFEAVRFEQGRIQNARFSSYRVPRCADVPELVTVLVNRVDLPSAGAGETPIAGVAPAIRNAIASLTGKRLRELPLRLA